MLHCQFFKSPCCSFDPSGYYSLVARHDSSVLPMLVMGLANAATDVGHACPYLHFACVACFFLIFQMPPRRSVRQKRPSSQALEVLAGADRAPARRRRATGPPSLPSGVEPPPPAGSESAPARRRRAAGPPPSHGVDTAPPPANPVVPVDGGNTLPNPVLPAGFLDQVVARVTTEVTRQLQPLLSGARTLQPDVPLQTEPAQPPRSNTANQVSATGHPAGSAPANQAPAPVQPTGPGIVPQDHREISVVGNPVQQVVTSLQSNLSGEQGLFPSLPQDPFTSINLPVDARVAMKLKTKIWQQEYIDFGSLLVNPTLDGKFQLTIHNSNEGLSPSLALEPLNKPKKISSIEMWLQAFHVFVGIYASRYPNEAPGLMKYGSTIQDLAARGHNWRFYDENFRFLRQSQATSLPWGTVHWELWLRSQSNLKKPSTSFTGSKPVSPISIPRGYCFKFHRGGDCAGCSFRHTCCKCEGAHRALHCNFRGPRGNLRISSQVRGANKSNSISTLPQANSTTLANSRKS